MKQAPAHSTGTRQRSWGYNTPSLHPLPSRCKTFRPRAHGLHTSLRFEPVQHAQLTMHHRFHSLTRFVLSPHLQVVSAYWLSFGASVTLGVLLNGTVPNQLMPCAPLAVPLPLGGGGTRLHQKNQKKDPPKKKWGGCLCITGSFRPPPSGCSNASIKESTRPFSIVSYSFRCCSMLLLGKKKRRLHTRAANATPPLRRQWSSQMLLSCGALPAVRDGLKTAVSAFGRFFA